MDWQFGSCTPVIKCPVAKQSPAPGPQEQRFEAYVTGLATAVGHADRHLPLRNYCKGLLLPVARKSIEPMAALLDPDHVQPVRQSLHHLVAKAAWSDEQVLEQVRRQVLPAMRKHGPIVAWIVDDAGLPKKGEHSVGVARQYCSQTGRRDNCQVAVSLSVANWSSSLPVAYRLYLPEEWAEDGDRRKKAEVPGEIPFQTRPEIALTQIRATLQAMVPRGVVLADATYGVDTGFREGITAAGLKYMVNVTNSTKVREPGHPPVPVEQLAMNLAPETGPRPL